jgi:S-layer homology domain
MVRPPPDEIGTKEGEMQPGERDEIQAIRAELEGLRARVDAVGSAGGRTWLARAAVRPRLAKRLTRVGLVALMLALPVVVSASHQFTDVPTSHTFHSAIAKLYGARLTAGCTATKFCPNANVTRGQMAAFLNRGLGRGAVDVGATGTDDDWAAFADNVLASVDLLHGGAPGGTGHVLVTASVTAYTEQAGVCPCELAVWLVNEGTLEESVSAFQLITDVPAPLDNVAKAWREGSASVSFLFTVPTGVTHTYDLGGYITTTTPPTGDRAGAEWNLSAIYIPFGATGGNPALTTTQGVDGRRGH